MGHPGVWRRATRAALPTAVMAVVGATRVAAQGAAALVLETPASTQALALGDVPRLDSREASILFYNPALLGRATGSAAALQRYGTHGTLGTLSSATAWGAGGVGFGVQVLTFGALVGVPLERDAQSTLLSDGPQGVAELVASLAYGRELLGMRAGIAAKVIDERVAGQRDGTIAADLGLAYDAGALVFGLVARNLGPDLTIGSQEAELPRLASATITLEEQWVGPLDVALTTGVTLRRDDEVIPAGGVQLSYWPVTGRTFTVRAGVQRVAGDARSPFTFGAAVALDGLTVEYAFQSFDASGDAHRFGVRWR